MLALLALLALLHPLIWEHVNGDGRVKSESTPLHKFYRR
jgi:hypothetical protein